LQKSVIRRARHIIQPTRYPEAHFGSSTSAQWHDTGNAISKIFFQEKSSSARVHMLYSGAVIRRKRLADLVEAFAVIADDVPGTMLRVAGPIAEASYAEEVRSVAEARGLSDRIVFLGLLDRSHLAEEYQACGVLVLPSGQETSPMVIAEAMASSAPVVATDVGGVRSLVSDGDVTTLADRLGTILKDPGLASDFGKAGYAKARESFTSEAVARKVLTVYEQVIREATSG